MSNITVGSICSGIEAASVAFGDLGFHFEWFSEIAQFPNRVLQKHYPQVPNLGDMSGVPSVILSGEAVSPDMICGGTPCQAFSLAGWKRGLEDARGNLTLTFGEIISANDEARKLRGLPPTVVLWENVEGVLKDRTNAFGSFVSLLAGLDREISMQRWPKAGLIYGPQRNVAWRVLDAKYFGLPQQRRRLYLIAGGKDFYPEEILFEIGVPHSTAGTARGEPDFSKGETRFSVFRDYTDCLYAAYGTKWNGNAAAYNGSLFVVQNDRIRRFTPLECERLMGFPDGYTALERTKPTSRYQALGNSWAVPVVRWIGRRLEEYLNDRRSSDHTELLRSTLGVEVCEQAQLYDLSSSSKYGVWTSERPIEPVLGKLEDIVEATSDEQFFLTPAGCKGILRRSSERRLPLNPKLYRLLAKTASLWSEDIIEEISRKQRRGRFSTTVSSPEPEQNLSLFEP